MEENKVVLKLEEYIKLVKENENLKQKQENKEHNYIALCNYIKTKIKKDEDYHLGMLKNDFNVEKTLTEKLQNYHYKNIVNAFLETGITFDLVEQLTDEVIKEWSEENE